MKSPWVCKICKKPDIVKKGSDYIILACKHELAVTMKADEDIDIQKE